MNPPSNLHSDVHVTPALHHLQFLLHAFVKPQSKRMAHALLASACVSKANISYYGHPIPKSGACSISLLMKLACNTDILKCSRSAAWVAGIFSNESLPVNNKL